MWPEFGPAALRRPSRLRARASGASAGCRTRRRAEPDDRRGPGRDSSCSPPRWRSASWPTSLAAWCPAARRRAGARRPRAGDRGVLAQSGVVALPGIAGPLGAPLASCSASRSSGATRRPVRAQLLAVVRRGACWPRRRLRAVGRRRAGLADYAVGAGELAPAARLRGARRSAVSDDRLGHLPVECPRRAGSAAPRSARRGGARRRGVRRLADAGRPGLRPVWWATARSTSSGRLPDLARDAALVVLWAWLRAGLLGVLLP